MSVATALNPSQFLQACLDQKAVYWDECDEVVQGAYDRYLADRLIDDYRLHADDDGSQIWDEYCEACSEHNCVLFIEVQP